MTQPWLRTILRRAAAKGGEIEILHHGRIKLTLPGHTIVRAALRDLRFDDLEPAPTDPNAKR